MKSLDICMYFTKYTHLIQDKLSKYIYRIHINGIEFMTLHTCIKIFFSLNYLKTQEAKSNFASVIYILMYSRLIWKVK